MIRRRTRAFGLLAFTAAAGASLAAPVMMGVETSTEERRILAQPCINGVMPGNPYARNCSMPQPGPRVRGQAPDANAIIACRNIPGCLSYYVNYPGRTVWQPPIPPR